MLNTFMAVSLAYHNAPLSVRGLFTLNEIEAKQLMLRMKESLHVSEVLVLSTCNRTEIYYSAAKDHGEEVVRLLLSEKDIYDVDRYRQYFNHLIAGDDAVQHLFEVSLGLQSQVVGDMQITNQVKQAYQWTVDLNLAGPFLHRLLHTIFFANKRVIQETAFRDGACSVSYATVDILRGLPKNANILVVGLGNIGADVVKNMPLGAHVTLINRTKSKSAELGAKFGHRVADFENIEDEIAFADVIVSSIVTDEPFFTKDKLMRASKYAFKYLIDLSVPISVSLDVEDIPGILVYNIDAIRSRTDETLSKRIKAIPSVHQIIAEAIGDFSEWSHHMSMQPTIHKLKQALEQIRN